MASVATIRVKKVTATEFRDDFKACASTARGEKVVLIENRRAKPKYLVDKVWLDKVLRERADIMATIEVLADRSLTDRLLNVAKTIDQDVKAGRLHTMEEVFGVER